VHAFLNASVTEPPNTYVEQEIGAAPTSPSPSIVTDVCRSGTPIRRIRTYISIQQECYFFLCNVFFVLCFCEPPSNIARIYIYMQIITSPKAQDQERRDLIAQD